jgi:hypothetical protein
LTQHQDISPALAVAAPSDDRTPAVERVARTLYYKTIEHELLTGPERAFCQWHEAPWGVKHQYRALAQVACDAYEGKPLSWLIPPPGDGVRKRKSRKRPVKAAA